MCRYTDRQERLRQFDQYLEWDDAVKEVTHKDQKEVHQNEYSDEDEDEDEDEG